MHRVARLCSAEPCQMGVRPGLTFLGDKRHREYIYKSLWIPAQLCARVFLLDHFEEEKEEEE